MSHHARWWPVLVGLVVSLVLHGSVIVPMLIAAMTGTSAARLVEARFDPEDFRETVPPSVETPLGMDVPASSTLTWVGYEEYREHLARLSEVDQAAFEPETAGAEPSLPASPPAPPAERLVEATEAEPAAADPTEATATPEGRPEPVPSEADALAFREWLQALQVPPQPGAEARQEQEEIERSEPAPLEELLRRLRDTLADTKQVAEAPPEPSPPGPPTSPGEESPRDADRADKESDATSVVEVPFDKLRLGQPLAARGLEIRPRRPRFTTLITVTAVPSNPLVEIRFGRDGRPVEARIVESSRDQRVDHAVETSLYRWRAAGEPLGRLGADETVDVRIRIMLTGR
jgi:protein TonB